MDAANIAAIGYAGASASFLALTALLLSRWRNRSQSQVLAIATFSSTIWAATVAAHTSGILSVAYLATLFEWLRGIDHDHQLARRFESLMDQNLADPLTLRREGIRHGQVALQVRSLEAKLPLAGRDFSVAESSPQCGNSRLGGDVFETQAVQ